MGQIFRKSKQLTVGCVILPKVLGLITAPHFPIPLPMNKSPSEKNPTFFIFKVRPTTLKFIVYSIGKGWK